MADATFEYSALNCSKFVTLEISWGRKERKEGKKEQKKDRRKREGKERKTEVRLKGRLCREVQAEFKLSAFPPG